MTQGPSLAPAYSFLRACRNEPIAETPIWIMRQAGRYLPEYRALREKHSFLDVCRTPELCAEVTAQPIERFSFDAAILFSDILIPLLAMGVPLDFDPGPKLGRTIGAVSKPTLRRRYPSAPIRSMIHTSTTLLLTA